MGSETWVRTGVASAAVIPATLLMANTAMATAQAATVLALPTVTGKTEYIPMHGAQYLQHLGIADGPALSGDGYVTTSYPDGLPMYHDVEARTPLAAPHAGIDASTLLILAPLYMVVLGMAGYSLFDFLRGRKPKTDEMVKSAEATPLPVVQDDGPETVAATPRAKAPHFGVKIGGEFIPGNSEPPPPGDGRAKWGGRGLF